MDRRISKYFFAIKPLFETLPDHESKVLRSQLRQEKVRKGKELFQEGTYPKGVYILKKGKVKIYQNKQNGGEQIIYIYVPGEMFGYRPLLCGERHPTSAKTIEECSLYFLPSKIFLEALRKSTFLSNILLQNLSLEFAVLVNRIAAFGQRPVKERLALSLLILQERYRKPGVTYPEILLSRADLAAFVGTTIETIARILTKFKTEKIIKVSGRKIVIMNAKILLQLTV